MPGPPAPSNDGWSGLGTGWSISATLLAGILGYGVIGFFLDRWLGTPRVFLAIGMLLGAGLSIYLVWVKHGKDLGKHEMPRELKGKSGHRA